MKVALLTGGKDAHYVGGLVPQLASRGARVVLIGSRDMAGAQGTTRAVEFHDFVGDSEAAASLLVKARRVLRYYARVVVLAARTDADLFHVLWFRKFPKLERILVTLYLKCLRKKLVFTAHNIDDEARDGKSTALSRFSLHVLYRLVDHIFVHTPLMRREPLERFGVPEHRVTVLPFGTNDVVPVPTTTRALARQRLGLDEGDRVLLFFGNLAPYKGVEDLIRALGRLVQDDGRLILVIAGQPKDKAAEPYWDELERLIDEFALGPYVRKDIRHIPDEEVGLFFRAADVSVLPYRRIYQSGVLALSYAQGVPVIVSDIASMKDDVIEGETGLVFRPADVLDLAKTIRVYFASALFANLDTMSDKIRAYGAERFSWERNADLTLNAYARTLRR